MTAVTRGEIYVGSTVLHGVINEIVARLPGGARAAVRRRRLRDRLDGDHQGRAQPRRREEVLRLGADAPRRRRSASTSRSTRSRPTATCRCRRRCRSSPTSRSSTTISRSTARARRASACSSAGRRRSAQAPQMSAMTTPAPARLLVWLAVGAIGFLLVPWYALQDSVLGARVAPQFARRRTTRPRCCRSLLHGTGLARAARRAAGRRRRAARRGDRRAATRANGADRARRDRLRLSASRRASRSARAAGTFESLAARSARLPAGSSAWDSAPRSSRTSFAMLFCAGTRRARLLQGRCVRRRQRRRASALLVARLHVLSGAAGS